MLNQTMKELLKQFAYFKSKSEYTFLTKKHTHTHTSPVISEKKADDCCKLLISFADYSLSKQGVTKSELIC